MGIRQQSDLACPMTDGLYIWMLTSVSVKENRLVPHMLEKVFQSFYASQWIWTAEWVKIRMWSLNNSFSCPTLLSCSVLFISFGTVLKLFFMKPPRYQLIAGIDETSSHAFAEGPALQRISNVSYYHATRLNINLRLGSRRQDCKCLRWASFPGPIIPPRDPELNFAPVMMAIWSDPNLGTCSAKSVLKCNRRLLDALLSTLCTLCWPLIFSAFCRQSPSNQRNAGVIW